MGFKRAGAAIIALGLTGCLFAGGSNGADGGPEDTGNMAEDTAVADSAQPDSGGAIDLGGGPDLATRDSGAPDMASPDAAEPDMPAPIEPYVVVRHHVLSLGGPPPPAAPLEVARFADGFIVGYRDAGAAKARIAWYNSEAEGPRENGSFDAGHGGVSVVGGPDFAAVSYLRLRTLVTRILRVAPNQPGWAASSEQQQVSTLRDYFETALALESGTVYLASTDELNNSPGLGLQPVDGMTGALGALIGLGESVSVDFTAIDAMGGAALGGRRVFVAGVAGSNYGLVDFQWPGGTAPWTTTLLGCGLGAANAAGGGRVIPLRDGWVAKLKPTPNGPRVSVSQCTSQGVGVELTPGPFADVRITDLAVAKEDLADGGDIGIAWLGPVGVGFGIASFDSVPPGAADINRPWHIDGTDDADRVRVAYNVDRQQWGVAVTRTAGGGADLYIIERNPAFP